MAEAIRVVPTSYGTSDWRVEFTDGAYICDIRIEISSTLKGSYYVLTDGRLAKEGTFNFRAWDEQAVRDVLTGIVRSMYPGADVAIHMQPRRARAAGA
jgi:hypothetical protein